MITSLQAHEAFMQKVIADNDRDTNWQNMAQLHDRKIRNFQHERLVHLLVMLTTSLASLFSFFFTLLLDIPAFFFLTFMLLVLSVAYVIHYFKLENGVQRLYKLSDKIEEKLQK
jgi:hypothetical protein